MKSVTSNELKEIIQLHDAWLKKKPEGKKADLSYTDLSGCDLSNQNLIRANFKNSKINNANLSNTNVSWADFRSADLHGAILKNTNFQFANLIFANLNSANLSSASFRNALMKMASIKEASFIHADLIQARMIGLDFSSAEFKNSDLSGAILINCKNIRDATWKGNDFSGIIIDALGLQDLPTEVCEIYSDTFVLVQPFAIVRTFEFPDEFRQTGLTILNYFSRIIEQKYPFQQFGVSVVQNKNKVTLVVETDRHYKTIIEATLDLYESVANQTITPEDFMHTAEEIVELRMQLDTAQLQADLYRAMMSAKNTVLGDYRKITDIFENADSEHNITETNRIFSPAVHTADDDEIVKEISTNITLIRQFLYDLSYEVKSKDELAIELRKVHESLEKLCNNQEIVDVKEVIENTGITNLLHSLKQKGEVVGKGIKNTEKGLSIINKLFQHYNKIAEIFNLPML